MSLPSRVTLELTNRCNRKCVSCPRLKIDYPLGDMSIELFNRIIDQLPSETTIVPFFRGESLLHPDFVEMMKLLERFDRVQIATNGDLIDDEIGSAMLKACSFISFSLHEFYYPYGYPWGDVMGSIQAAKFEGIQTQVSILDSVLDGNDKEGFIETWLECVDRVRIYIEHSVIGFGDVSMRHKTITEYHPCSKVLSDMVVYWDGKVALCNHDWNSKLSLGNLNDESVEFVWNGYTYNEVRRLHEFGCRKTVSSCKDCDYWMVEFLPNKMFGEVYTS